MLAKRSHAIIPKSIFFPVLVGTFLFLVISYVLASPASAEAKETSGAPDGIAITTSASEGTQSGAKTDMPSASETKAKKKPKAKKGLYRAKSGELYYYTKKHKKARSTWKHLRRGSYYFGSDGRAYTGAKRISGLCYLFADDGKLCTGKGKRLVRAGKRTYYVTRAGQALTGWQVRKGKLYHFSRYGKMEKNKLFGQIWIGDDGAADKSTATSCKIEATKLVGRISKNTDSASAKLKKAWGYVTSRKNFQYRAIYPNLEDPLWQYETGRYMLSKRRGNCYSFACAFAAMACSIGYSPELCVGRVSGSTDRAPDGFTRHCWVRINGKYYDPELDWAGSVKGIYASKVYPVPFKDTVLHRF